MGLENTSAGLNPKVLEKVIEMKYVQASTGKALLYYNSVESDVVETISEDDTKGGFDYIDKDNGVPPEIQTLFKKTPRTIEPFSATLDITKKEMKVAVNIARARLTTAATQWADYVDTLVYGMFSAKAGFTDSTITAWGDPSSTPLKDVSYAMSEITDATGLEPDTVVLSNKAFHYLATSAGLTSQTQFPTGANAYVLTGKLEDILGLKLLRTKNVGNNVYVVRRSECGKWDSFLDPVTYTYTDLPNYPLLYSKHTMLEWGAPSVSMKKLIYKLEGAGAAA